jgi:flagellar hook-associated protein 2
MTSTFNFGGIMSGLNTQSIIDGLMAIDRQPLQQLQQQVSDEQNRQSVIQGIETQVSGVQTALGSLLLPSTVNAKLVSTDTSSSGTPVVTAVANSSAVNGSFGVTVKQLATATQVLSGSALGQTVDRTAMLANAGLNTIPVTTSNGNPATFSINGKTISVDATTTLDDGTANSLISKINAAGAGVTASLIADPDGRANNRVQLVSAPGQTIQLGSLGDTSNILRALDLADATVQGNTAASVTSGAAAAGALNTSITINGVTTAINQTDGSFTAQQNAAFIANAINQTANSTAQATANNDGTISLQQTTLGSQSVINITAADAATGFADGQTQNGTDKVVSTANLGTVDLGKSLASSRLATAVTGLDSNGNGQFTINGVAINYSAGDSIATVLNRINASNAGVSAMYDPIQDRIRLTAGQTGARTISLADVTGNFLSATGVLNTSQTLGRNALFSIDSVNNGQLLSSNTNQISGYIPGVTMTLKSASATPVTVTVSQDTATTVSAVQNFITAVNSALDSIDSATQYDATAKQAAPLLGDSGIQGIASTLRSMLSSAAVGLGGKYRSLGDIGISSGPIGSAPGSTNHLVLDQNKLTAALQDNPQAVQAVFSSFTTTLAPPSGAGNITAVSGTPISPHDSGTYQINVIDASNNVNVQFLSTSGNVLFNSTGTLTPGVQNTTLIPGLTLTANSTLAVGQDNIGMTVSTRGVAVGLSDYLNSLLNPDGFFAGRQDSSTAIQQSLNQQISDAQDLLQQKQDALMSQFTSLETTLAQMQGQNSGLLSMLGASTASVPTSLPSGSTSSSSSSSTG